MLNRDRGRRGSAADDFATFPEYLGFLLNLLLVLIELLLDPREYGFLFKLVIDLPDLCPELVLQVRDGPFHLRHDSQVTDGLLGEWLEGLRGD